MSSKRITVQRVKDAYRRKPFYPVAGVYRDGEAGRCPISAVASAERKSPPSYRLTGINGHQYLRELARKLGLSENYLKSFIDGYELVHDFDPGRHTKTGFDDGFRVREHVPPAIDYHAR